ncbi:MAG: hypothetical protein JWP49_928 [Phenylobacterium sp.]|jgi:hypothetical protein|nr:hypothetical protein [Phenylobacterium sp.]
MTPKLLLAAVAALAMAVGFALPGPHRDEAQARSQIPMQVIGES